MSIPDFYDPPRLCTLQKWPQYAGYGFNLHAEKGKAGQFIGKIDPDSPADLGGLKEKDVVIEVNETNIESLHHHEVVNLAKKYSNHLKLLVCCMETYNYCRENQITITEFTNGVIVCETPEEQPVKGVNAKNKQDESEKQEVDKAQPDASNDRVDAEAATNDNSNNNDGYGNDDGGDNDDDNNNDDDDDYINRKPVIFQTTVPLSSVPPREPEDGEQEMEETDKRSSSSSATAAAPQSKPELQQQQQQQQEQKPATVGSKSADPLANVSLQEMLAKTGQSRRNQVKYESGSFAAKYQSFQAL